jgi:hypothetical protein
MRDSTETLTMFAQLLATQPPILPSTARKQVEELAAKLADIPETEADQAAKIIMAWIAQFPQEEELFGKELAKNRQELDELDESDPNKMQWLIPNFQIIEEEKVTAILPPGSEQKMSLLAYIRQKLEEFFH